MANDKTITTISVTVPAGVKAEATAVATTHGFTLSALLREMFERIAAGDREALAWIEEARSRYT